MILFSWNSVGVCSVLISIFFYRWRKRNRLKIEKSWNAGALIIWRDTFTSSCSTLTCMAKEGTSGRNPSRNGCSSYVYSDDQWRSWSWSCYDHHQDHIMIIIRIYSNHAFSQVFNGWERKGSVSWALHGLTSWALHKIDFMSLSQNWLHESFTNLTSWFFHKIDFMSLSQNWFHESFTKLTSWIFHEIDFMSLAQNWLHESCTKFTSWVLVEVN